LGWQPKWDFERTIKETVMWYKQASQISPDRADLFQALTLGQIDTYQSDLASSTQTSQVIK